MKRFWTTVLGSFVGVWLGLMIFSVLSVVMSFAFVGAMSSFGATSKSINKNSILHINLSGDLTERNDGNDIDPMKFVTNSDSEKSSLATILKSIKAAKTNDSIKGIYLEGNGIGAGVASLSEIRAALNDFKKCGKFIYAYSDNYSQADYYLTSVADSIFLNPIGAIDIHGIGGSTPYFKNLLDKGGVEMQVVRVGTFKSAVEPYMLTEMSEANRLQQEHYLGNIWKDMTDSISKSRKVPVAKINEMADSLVQFETSDFYVKSHLVDALCYRFEVENRLRKLTDVDKDDDLNLVSPSEVVAATESEKSSKNQIAVFYAEGEIDGTSDDGIDSKSLTKYILDAANDKDVKGVVLRVNSPGGSAFGSEQIWKALQEVKKAGKPFAVSMGDYAASGGYYISCGADRIFAEPVTVTGSIGIFGMIPCVENLATEKLGVNFCGVHTNANSDMTIFKRLSPFQRARLQKMVNEGYELFTSRCAAGRKMPIDSIKKIAEGRVWDGASAKALGLVDEYGNLNSAIRWVAQKANLGDDYETIALPVQEDKFLKFISKYAQTKMSEMLKSNTGELYQYHDVLKRILGRDQLQCLMEPVEIR